MSAIKAKDFDGSEISLTKPTEQTGIKMAWVKNQKRTLMFQITAPIQYGVSDYKNNKKFALTIAIDPENEKHSDFIKACSTLKKTVIKQISENAKDFGLTLKNPTADIEVMESEFCGPIKVPDDDSEKSEYSMKLNLLKKKDTEEFDIKLYDNEKNLMEGADPKEHLRRGATITAVIAVQSVWVKSKKELGIKLKLQHARIDVPAPVYGKADPFADDAEAEEKPKAATGGAGTGGSRFAALAEDDEDDVLADVLPPTAAAPAPASKVIEDEEDDDGEVIQPPPVPKKGGVKKLVKKTA